MLKRSDIYNGHIPTKRLGRSAPASVKEQLWEKLHLIYIEFNGQFYYIDTRYESPYGFDYDIWVDNGKHKLQHRVEDLNLSIKISNYFDRKKKINKILGKED